MNDIGFVAVLPGTTFLIRQSRVRLHIEFTKRDSQWLSLGYGSAAKYAAHLTKRAIETLNDKGFSQQGAEALAVAALYTSWLAGSEEDFDTTHGVVLAFEDGVVRMGGFSEDRWHEIVGSLKLEPEE